MTGPQVPGLRRSPETHHGREPREAAGRGLPGWFRAVDWPGLPERTGRRRRVEAKALGGGAAKDAPFLEGKGGRADTVIDRGKRRYHDGGPKDLSSRPWKGGTLFRPASLERWPRRSRGRGLRAP